MKSKILLLLIGIIPTCWLALLTAPYLAGGLPEMFKNFGRIMNQPFFVEICEDSLKTVLLFLLLYGVAAAAVLTTGRNFRRREEHGSARWGNAGTIGRKYAGRDKVATKILTQNVSIGLDGRKYRRNLNVLVCGGSGSGKTRFYAKPNVMQANSSLVILDPKGQNLVSCPCAGRL